RPEDIPLLVRHFVQQFSRQMSKTIDTILSETMNTLLKYPWPGNIRELQNVIERAVILTTGPVLKVPSDDLHAVSNGSVSPPAAIGTRWHLVELSLKGFKIIATTLGGPYAISSAGTSVHAQDLLLTNSNGTALDTLWPIGRAMGGRAAHLLAAFATCRGRRARRGRFERRHLHRRERRNS